MLSAGAIGTISVALIARAGLAHHGRAPVASAVMVAAYGLVSLAAILRVAALFVPDAFIALVIASGVVWAFGFAMFVAGYLPMLLRPRALAPLADACRKSPAISKTLSRSSANPPPMHRGRPG